MKRIYFIALFALSMSFVSCEKEVILPESQNTTSESIKYRSGTVLDSGVSADSDDETGDGDITDPNSDKDESARRKK
jgi:hypothetical protein